MRDVPTGNELQAISGRFKDVADALVMEGVNPAAILMAQIVPLTTLAYVITGANRAKARDMIGEMLDSVIGVVDEAARKHGIQSVVEKIGAAEDRGDHGEALRLVKEAKQKVDLM